MEVLVKSLVLKKNETNIFNNDVRNFLSIGEKYTVYAISVIEGFTYFQIYAQNKLLIIPYELFDLIDNRVSKYWKLKITKKSQLFCPDVFLEDYFHDDLSEDVETVLDKFRIIKQKMDIEFSPAGASIPLVPKE